MVRTGATWRRGSVAFASDQGWIMGTCLALAVRAGPRPPLGQQCCWSRRSRWLASATTTRLPTLDCGCGALTAVRQRLFRLCTTTRRPSAVCIAETLLPALQVGPRVQPRVAGRPSSPLGVLAQGRHGIRRQHQREARRHLDMRTRHRTVVISVAEQTGHRLGLLECRRWRATRLRGPLHCWCHRRGRHLLHEHLTGALVVVHRLRRRKVQERLACLRLGQTDGV